MSATTAPGEPMVTASADEFGPAHVSGATKRPMRTPATKVERNAATFFPSLMGSRAADPQYKQDKGCVWSRESPRDRTRGFQALPVTTPIGESKFRDFIASRS